MKTRLRHGVQRILPMQRNVMWLKRANNAMNWLVSKSVPFFNQAVFVVINPFGPSQLSTPNFSWHNTYKIRHLVMRKWQLIKQSKLPKINSKILSNLFNEKYELKLGEFKNTTGTEMVKDWPVYPHYCLFLRVRELQLFFLYSNCSFHSLHSDHQWVGACYALGLAQ